MFVSLFAESFGSVVDYIFYAARLGHPRPLQFVHRHYEVIGLQGIKLSQHLVAQHTIRQDKVQQRILMQRTVRCEDVWGSKKGRSSFFTFTAP